MSKATHLQSNLTAGELSPLLSGRVDLGRYHNSGETVGNWLIRTQGALQRRPGTQFIYESKFSTKACRLIPFVFNADQTYILEFGDYYVRFYRDKGVLMSGVAAYEVVTPWPEADLARLYVIQTADTLIIVHPDYPAYKLQRSGHISWALNLWNFLDGPYLDENTDDNIVLAPSAQTGNITVTAYTKSTTEMVVNGDFNAAGSWVWNKGWSHDAVNGEADRAVTLEALEDASRANPCVITWVGHGLPSGGQVTIAGVVQDPGDWDSLNGTHVITWLSADTFSVPVNSSGYVNPYNPGVDPGTIVGTQALEQNVGAAAAKRYRLVFTVKNLTAGSVTPQVGGVNGATRSADGTYSEIILTTGTGNLKFTPSLDFDGSIDDVSCILHTLNNDIFQAAHVGSFWRLKYGATWGYVKVTGFVSGAQVTATVQSSLAGVTPTPYWREGAFSGVRGYPAAATFHDERLYFGGTAHQPQTIWGSESGNFENFAPEGTITDAGPVTYSFASDQMNPIIWLMSASLLMAGTTEGEWKISATSAGSPITPTDVNVRQVNNKGSAALRPVKVGDVVLFFQGNARKLRELTYRYELDSWVAPDLTILSEHITLGGVVSMALQKEPDQTIWAVRDDGTLLSMVYEREQEVVGWSRHTTDGWFEDVACIPGDNQTEVWVVVRRTINGSTRRYIECFTNIEYGGELLNACFVDSALAYDGAPATILSGLEHLEGKTVQILGDGAVRRPATVGGGEITLDRPLSRAVVGLPYTSLFKSVRLEAGGETGPAQGKLKRIDHLVLRLYQTSGGKAGPDVDNLETMFSREMGDAMDTAPPLFAGDWKLDYRGDYDREGQVVIVQDEPLPLTLCALITSLATNEM